MSLCSSAMRDYADLNRRLADLLVGFGANVQPGQIVAITTYSGKEALTREVTRAAYEHGAKWVDVLINDPWVKRERLLHAAADSLEFVPPWMVDRLEWLSAAARGAHLAQRPVISRRRSRVSTPLERAAICCPTSRIPARSSIG